MVSCLISFQIFGKEQFCMFSLLLEFSDSVSAFIIAFDSLSHPVVCLVVMNPDPPPAPRLSFTYPSPLPRPPTSSGHSRSVVHSMCPLSWVCALSSCLIKWCFSPIAVSRIGVSLCSYRRRQWQPTPVLLPGQSHGRRNLVGCSPWGRTESDTTEVT